MDAARSTAIATRATLPSATWAWLGDGTPVRLRSIRATDLELERRFVAGLSRETRYQRLMSGRELQPGELERWTDIDPAREIALIAVASVDGAQQQLGVARCIRDGADPQLCEFAIVIGDGCRHQGLGETLLRALMHAAADAGIERFGGITLSDNRSMIALARKLGFGLRREPGDATVMRVGIDLRSWSNMTTVIN